MTPSWLDTQHNLSSSRRSDIDLFYIEQLAALLGEDS